MRILGVDFGDSRTGLAVCDASETLASGLETVHEKCIAETAKKVAQKAAQHQVELIVVGNPLNMDGSAGFRAQKTARFIEQLKEHTSLPIELYDERLTTVSGHHFLQDTRTFGQKRKNVVDTLSAEIILQDYLERKHRKSSSNS